LNFTLVGPDVYIGYLTFSWQLTVTVKTKMNNLEITILASPHYYQCKVK